MSEKGPELSVVVLCYRSGDFASVFAAELKKVLEENRLDYEMVLVGNYQPAMKDSDKTPAIVRNLAAGDPRIIAVVKEKQGMMGWDMRSGLEAASGQAIAVIDGDGQMPVIDVVRVYRKLVEGDFEIAKTYRTIRFDGLKRVLISKVYNLAAKILFPSVKVRDINSKPKIFRRSALEKLRLESDGWFIDAEIIIKASNFGISIGEVPTEFHSNKHRPSFVRAGAIFEFIFNLLYYRLKLWGTRG
jgi:glycosyltransferase involved in cell wall biosynthesis